MKKILIATLCIVLSIIVIYLVLMTVLSYVTKYRVRQLCEFFSPDNEYSLVIQQIGEPEFTEDHHVRIILSRSGHEIERYDTLLMTDGGQLYSVEFTAEWYDNRVEVLFPVKTSEESKNLVIWLE